MTDIPAITSSVSSQLKLANGKKVKISLEEHKEKVVVSMEKIENGGKVTTELHIQPGDDQICQTFSFFDGKPCWTVSDETLKLSENEKKGIAWAKELLKHLKDHGTSKNLKTAKRITTQLEAYAALDSDRDSFYAAFGQPLEQFILTSFERMPFNLF